MPNDQGEHSPADQGNTTGHTDERVVSEPQAPLSSRWGNGRRIVQGAALGTILASLPLVFTPPRTLVFDSVMLGIYVWIAVRFRRAPSRFTVGVALARGVVGLILSGLALLATIGSDDPAWQILCRAVVVLMEGALIVGTLRVAQEKRPPEARPSDRRLLADTRLAAAIAMLPVAMIVAESWRWSGLWGLIALMPYGLVLWRLRRGADKIGQGLAVGLGCLGSVEGLGGLLRTWGSPDMERAPFWFWCLDPSYCRWCRQCWL